MCFLAAKASGEKSEHVLKVMPMAHAIQWQAIELESRGIDLCYSKATRAKDYQKELEKVLNA